VELGIGEELFVTIPRGRYDDLEARMQMQPQLTAPLEQGAVVGQVAVTLDGESVAERDLLTLAPVEQAGFFGSTWDGLRLWFDGMFEDEEAEPGAE
jgi:D-alanyl-D-alanine carboxypeptidase (penicillin-binding protein 5/6)